MFVYSVRNTQSKINNNNAQAQNGATNVAAAVDDPVLQQLLTTMREGWPESRSDLPEPLYPYFNVRDLLTVQNDLVFKGQCLVVPGSLRKELMAVAHSSHIGMEGCMRRACDSLYWPRMATELKEYIAKCDICLSHRTEPLLRHKVIARPWAKVAANLCKLDNRTLLVIIAYYSNFIEVARLNSVTSHSIMKEMKAVFARYGIPEVLVTDNGPQFAVAEFAVFAKSWMFQHIMSSPHYSQSNGKAENVVKTVKQLFTKCKESGQSEFLALLDWRNTPTAGVGTSPAQCRCCKTLLPIMSTLLQPCYSTDEESRAIMGNTERQRYYYKKHTKPPQHILQGVRMKLPGQKVSSAGTCLGPAGPRSYNVRINGSVYRHNRSHLVRSKEPPMPEVTETEPVTLEPSSKTVTEDQEPATTMPGLRRSQQICKTPARWSDFVPH